MKVKVLSKNEREISFLIEGTNYAFANELRRIMIGEIPTMAIEWVDFRANDTPMPDETGSQIQTSKISGKTGYCFIGEDKGFRTCVNVTEDDECMSGDIFPSREICMNPSLRQ